MPDRCSSCDEPILWAKTAKGTAIPLDFQPIAVIPKGVFTIDGEGDDRLATYQRPANLYRSHFATCPYADQHRKAK